MGHTKFSVGIAILGILYSTAYCDKSSILSILRAHYKSDSPSSSSLPSTQQDKNNPSSSSGKYQFHLQNQGDDASTVRRKLISSSKNYNATVSNSTVLVTGHNRTGSGRQFTMGWNGHTSNLDLYSILGGLAFLGLIASLFVFLSNRTSTPTITIIAGRRKRAINGEGDDELLGETFSEFLSKLGLTLDSPWWNGDTQIDKRNVVPFKLV